MSRRAMVGGTIIAAWIAGIAVLVQREFFRPQLERLAEAAARVTPGAVYFGVMQNGRQVGFASSTVDTSETSIGITDYLVADQPNGATTQRFTARTNVTATRGLRVSAFDFSTRDKADGPFISGRTEGDSVLAYQLGKAADAKNTFRLPISGPILVPSLIPLFVTLNEAAKTGNHYTIPVFSPLVAAAKPVSIRIAAESTFVVNDSAVFDSATARWHGVKPDSIHAWHLVTTSSGDMGFDGWVDDQGRTLQAEQFNYVLQRMPYEVAFENWRADSGHVAVTDDRDVLETTAIAANRRIDGSVKSLQVRLSGVSLAGLDLEGGHQSLSGDTLRVTTKPDSELAARRSGRADSRYLFPEPLIQSDNANIRDLANALRATGPNRRAVVERLARWVQDSIKQRVTFGTPSALQVLKSRAGDANEHAQLFVALARAINIPARAVVGLAYIDGKFYDHAWAEVMLDDWTAVDPTFGQFPADAAHLRFAAGGLARQAEIIRLIGGLKIDVLAVNGAPAPRRSSVSK